MLYRTLHDKTLGPITITGTEGYISHVDFGPASAAAEAIPATKGTCHVLDAAVRQLEAYLAGTLQAFELPIAIQGTPFQHSVWQALRTIPYGETRTYGQIAAAIGKPKAARAVGLANNKNPFAILVPCHRVIGAKGNLVGYAGGLAIKQHLLDLEATHK